MYKSKLSALFLLAMLVAGPSYAQDYKIQALDKDLNPIENPKEIAEKEYNFSDFDLDSALEIALNSNRTIKNAATSVEKADAAVWQARTAASTKVTAEVTQTKLEDGQQRGVKNATIDDVNGSHIRLTQPIYLGQADRAGITSARLGRDIAKSSQTLTKQNIIMSVSRAYYNWLYAREVENVGKMDLDLAQAHYDLVNKRFQAEQTSKYELLRADVRLAQYKSSYLSNKNDAVMAKLSLLKLLSLPMDTELDTTAKLEIEEINPNVEEDLANAVNLREDLKISRARRKIADQSLVAARSGGKPSVVLSAQWGYDKPSSRLASGRNADDTWNATLALSMPIMDASLTKSKVKDAKAGIKEAENNYNESLENTELEVYRAALSLQNAIEVLASQKENLKQAEETLRLAKVRYENGLFTQIDLFDAENAWSNAKLIYLQAIFNHHNARLAYQLAVGKLGRDIKGF